MHITILVAALFFSIAASSLVHAAGDATRGEQLYESRCMACHSLARIIHQPQKSTTESACDVRITPAQSPHRMSRFLKPAHQMEFALHQSVDLLPPSTQHPHSPLGLTPST